MKHDRHHRYTSLNNKRGQSNCPTRELASSSTAVQYRIWFDRNRDLLRTGPGSSQFFFFPTSLMEDPSLPGSSLFAVDIETISR